MPTNQCLPFFMCGIFKESKKNPNFIFMSMNMISYTKKLRRCTNVSINIDFLMTFDACIKNISTRFRHVFAKKIDYR